MRLAILLVLTFGLAASAAEKATKPRLESFTLKDQYGNERSVSFPRDRPMVLVVGDRQGSEQVDDWIGPLKERLGGKADLVGIAEVNGVPSFLRGRVTAGIRKARQHPVLLDFSGVVTKRLRPSGKVANVYVISPQGVVRAQETGRPDDAKLDAVSRALNGEMERESGSVASVPD